MVVHTKVARPGHMLYIRCPKIRFFREPKGLHLTGRILEYIFIPLIIYVCDAKTALGKQNPFTSLVILEILVLIRTNVCLLYTSRCV